MSIHFKFKSAKEYDTVTFPGNMIRIIDLKKLDLNLKVKDDLHDKLIN